MLGTAAFRENCPCNQTFENLGDYEFTDSESADYLEVPLATFCQYILHGEIGPSHVVAGNPFFSARDLKSFKLTLLEKRATLPS